MNVKKFILGGIVGGIADFLLGWLLWGILFAGFFPQKEDSQMNMPLIFLGCMTFGFFISYIFSKWTGISTAFSGAKAGAVIALFLTLFNNFFHNSEILMPNYKLMALDIILTTCCGAIVGAIIGFLNRKIK